MDQERTHSFLFLVLFVFLLLLPCLLSSLQDKDYSASTETKANSSVSLSTEFSFSVQRSSSPPVFFFSSEKLLLLDEAVIAVDLLEFKNGGVITAGVFYHGRNRCLIIWLLHPRNGFKKPVLSAKFNLGKLFLHFSAFREAGNDTTLVIKSRSFEIFSPGSFQSENYGKKYISLGVYTPVLAVISIFSAIWSYLRNLFKKKKETPEITSPNPLVSTPDSSISNLLVGFHKFRYSELSAATKDFHQSELLGRGRYASVYRAIFRGSINMYAVKRFNQSVSSKFSFEVEVTAIHRLRHRKILELRGWCNENPNEPLLVYDYMHNRSLEKALWNRIQTLLWPLRYQIAVGVAEALVYLHEECMPPVIHGDIKEGNVMLDVDFNPKLGDFGLAMSVPPYILRREKTERDPPECQPCEEVTEKVDVYLYGSMVFGLCCRRTEQLKKFTRKLHKLKLEGRLLEAVDERLNGKYNAEEMLRLLNVALQCVEPRVQHRPSMVQVLQILTLEEGERQEPEPIFHIEI